MVPKTLLLVAALFAVTLAGCTAGNDNGGNGTSTSTSGGAGAGGCVSGPAGGVCANTTASASGSASASSTNSSSTTTNSSAPMTASVMLKGQKFVNDTVTIRVGGSVTWTHEDGTMQHTVTANDGSFDSHPGCNAPVLPVSDCMKQGDTYSHTFTTAGTFEYHCKVHSSMTAKVIVVA